MRLRSLHERELIAAIRREFSKRSGDLLLGIGDDAAIIKAGRKPLLLTTDLLIENVHFIAAVHPPYYLGRKAINVNLSDIAAMGGVPRFALLGLGLNEKTKTTWVRAFFRGLKRAAQEHGVSLIGGDISASRDIAIAVTVIGEGGNFVTRNGAKAGDLIFVSGCLGEAAAGFRLLKKGYSLGRDKRADVLLKAFLDPVPAIALGRALSRLKIASAMIDMSDGLSVDLSHVCEESGVGAEVYLERLPLSPAIRLFEKRPKNLALHGGEDYHLLFTVAPRRLIPLARLQKRYKIFCLGRIREKAGIFLVDKKGKKRPLGFEGFQHFA